MLAFLMSLKTTWAHALGSPMDAPALNFGLEAGDRKLASTLSILLRGQPQLFPRSIGTVVSMVSLD